MPFLDEMALDADLYWIKLLIDKAFLFSSSPILSSHIVFPFSSNFFLSYIFKLFLKIILFITRKLHSHIRIRPAALLQNFRNEVSIPIG